MEYVKPDIDQIEASLFGPGYGESLVLHIGNDQWVIVDSCIDTNSEDIAPLRYLNELGVCLSNVKHIIASHWHDDHTRGLHKVVQACKNAHFWCPAPMTKQEFLYYAKLYQKPQTRLPTGGTTEIYNVFKLIRERSQPIHRILPNQLILKNNYCSLFTLSPTSQRFEEFLQMFSELAQKDDYVRAPQIKPNSLSVSLWASFDSHGALFGGDVEEQNNKGWHQILHEQTCIDGSASLFKIPHHGSNNAHKEEVWSNICSSNVTSILSPFSQGKKKLPSPKDVDRICKKSYQSFATSSPSRKTKAKFNSVTEKEFKAWGIKVQSQPRSLG